MENPLPSSEELIDTNDEIYDLWHNGNNKDDSNNNIPIPPGEIKAMDDKEILKRVNHLALSAYNQKNVKDLVEFLHACAVYPLIDTWIKAIKKGFYLSWPKLDRFKGPQRVAKHLLKQITTRMGHMKVTRQVIQSTKSK